MCDQSLDLGGHQEGGREADRSCWTRLHVHLYYATEAHILSNDEALGIMLS